MTNLAIKSQNATEIQNSIILEQKNAFLRNAHSLILQT